MKVVAINGSTRSDGNTHAALEIVGLGLVARGKEHGEDIEYTIIDLAKKKLNPCRACYGCRDKNECIQNDDVNEIFKELHSADGIILGSPTYFSNVSSRMQMFIERIGIINKTNGELLAGKVGASVAVARRQGANVVYAALNYFFGIAQMPIASSTYWNIGLGKEKGEVKNDEEGVKTFENLGHNMADMLCKLRG
ncbi:MAG: flavodoxin family protein [Candidatus Lokiarchaeota archaeon]|nr:flavodoxin family protein [Candidatus Lokiarchaeota archaeon]